MLSTECIIDSYIIFLSSFFICHSCFAHSTPVSSHPPVSLPLICVINVRWISSCLNDDTKGFYSTFRVCARAGFLYNCPDFGAWPSIRRFPSTSFPESLRAATQFAQCWAVTSATGNPTSASSTAPLSTSCRDSYESRKGKHSYYLTGKKKHSAGNILLNVWPTNLWL